MMREYYVKCCLNFVRVWLILFTPAMNISIIKLNLKRKAMWEVVFLLGTSVDIIDALVPW